ncbi:MAG: VirB4 family type IV secretion system protein, partial [Lachnospirales bacterium]
KIDDTYTAYMFIPSDGYKPKVLAAWTSLIVNAGEGIDLDIFFSKERKDKIQQKLGQQIRINRSKIKDTQDTNSDFEDLENAIHSGYYMKNGLSNNQDFYYANMLITITGDTIDEINWRVREMKKLMLSQDLNVHNCIFREEQSFLSTLPLLNLNKELYNLTKRNMLTSGIASCYPFTSFEMCDNNGILLGVNRHNNSLIIVDIFNSKIYKNANIAILGTSGAGKTFTMQLMALRMRRKHIQTFIVAPLKGHEFYRACKNIGGEFIQISPSSKNCINILEIRKTDNAISELIDEMDIEKSLLASKIQRVHIFFSLLIPDITHEERQLLDEALIVTYDRKDITHDNESLFENKDNDELKQMPILGDLYDVLLEKQETKRIANILARLVTGSAKTFNQHTNVNLQNKYTVLDISELSGDLLTVGMFVALDFVWDKAKEDRTKEKAVFIDEVWQLIGASSNKLAAEFVLEIFKIIRGYGGSAICGTQDLNDFFSLDDGKYGKGIINNSKTKIILNLEDEETERVSKAMHLSETEILEITHFERGNGLISTNNNNVTVEFKASKLETELITTDRAELKSIAESRKEKNYI